MPHIAEFEHIVKIKITFPLGVMFESYLIVFIGGTAPWDLTPPTFFDDAISSCWVVRQYNLS